MVAAIGGNSSMDAGRKATRQEHRRRHRTYWHAVSVALIGIRNQERRIGRNDSIFFGKRDDFVDYFFGVTIVFCHIGEIGNPTHRPHARKVAVLSRFTDEFQREAMHFFDAVASSRELHRGSARSFILAEQKYL